MYQDGSNGVNGPIVSAHPMCLNRRVSASEVPCMYGRPTLILGLVPVDVLLLPQSSSEMPAKACEAKKN